MLRILGIPVLIDRRAFQTTKAKLADVINELVDAVRVIGIDRTPADELVGMRPDKIGNQLLIGIGAGIAIALLSLTHFYQDLESSSYDFRFLKRNDWTGQPMQLPFIATIDIDDAATQAHGFPFKRNLHADLVEVISQFGARVIGFDIFFYEPAGQTLSLLIGTALSGVGIFEKAQGLVDELIGRGRLVFCSLAVERPGEDALSASEFLNRHLPQPVLDFGKPYS